MKDFSFSSNADSELTKLAHAARLAYATPIAEDARRIVRRRNGDLAAHVEIHDEEDATYIGGNLPYGAAQERGARPHDIRPTGGRKYLRFVVDGQVVFTKIVHHPGNKPYPYLRPALFQNRDGEAGGSFAPGGAVRRLPTVREARPYTARNATSRRVSGRGAQR